MKERDIERLAKSLGGSAAERLDVEGVAGAVLARLRAQPAEPAQVRRQWWSAPMVLRMAAALAVLVTGGLLVRGALEKGSESAAIMAPILRDLSTDELTEVFDSLSIEAPVHESVAVGIEDLNEAQLRELLRLLEG